MNRLIVVGIAAMIVPAANSQELRVGFAEADITPKISPDEPVFVAGFGHNRKATGVLDPIMVRVVVLSDGKKTVALACADLVGLFNDVAQKVREKVKGVDYIVVSSTHNHEGPDTLGLWGSSPFKTGINLKYQQLVVDTTAATIAKALEKTVAVQASIGSVDAGEILADNREPYIKHSDLVAIRFANADGKPVGAVVQWNNHPETLGSKNTKLSADYVGVALGHLSKKHGCPFVYLTGTVGGLMTSLKVVLKNEKGEVLPEESEAKNAEYGRRVAEFANSALAKAVPVKLTPIEPRSKAILLPVANEVFKMGWRGGVLDRPFYLWDGNIKPAKLIETKDLTRSGALLTEVGYIKLGELEVAVVPGEIYPELVLDKVQNPADPGADFPNAPIEPAIYKQLSAKHKMIIGLGNDEIGYIIPKRQWDNKAPYCYGRKTNQYGEINSLGPDTAPLLCGAFADLVKGK